MVTISDLAQLTGYAAGDENFLSPLRINQASLLPAFPPEAKIFLASAENFQAATQEEIIAGARSLSTYLDILLLAPKTKNQTAINTCCALLFRILHRSDVYLQYRGTFDCLERTKKILDPQLSSSELNLATFTRAQNFKNHLNKLIEEHKKNLATHIITTHDQKFSDLNTKKKGDVQWSHAFYDGARRKIIKIYNPNNEDKYSDTATLLKTARLEVSAAELCRLLIGPSQASTELQIEDGLPIITTDFLSNYRPFSAYTADEELAYNDDHTETLGRILTASVLLKEDDLNVSNFGTYRHTYDKRTLVRIDFDRAFTPLWMPDSWWKGTFKVFQDPQKPHEELEIEGLTLKDCYDFSISDLAILPARANVPLLASEAKNHYLPRRWPFFPKTYNKPLENLAKNQKFLHGKFETLLRFMLLPQELLKVLFTVTTGNDADTIELLMTQMTQSQQKLRREISRLPGFTEWFQQHAAEATENTITWAKTFFAQSRYQERIANLDIESIYQKSYNELLTEHNKVHSHVLETPHKQAPLSTAEELQNRKKDDHLDRSLLPATERARFIEKLRNATALPNWEKDYQQILSTLEKQAPSATTLSNTAELQKWKAEQLAAFTSAIASFSKQQLTKLLAFLADVQSGEKESNYFKAFRRERDGQGFFNYRERYGETKSWATIIATARKKLLLQLESEKPEALSSYLSVFQFRAAANRLRNPEDYSCRQEDDLARQIQNVSQQNSLTT